MPGRADAAAQSAEVAAAAIDEFDRGINRAAGDGAPPEALAFERSPPPSWPGFAASTTRNPGGSQPPNSQN